MDLSVLTVIIHGIHLQKNLSMHFINLNIQTKLKIFQALPLNKLMEC